MVLMNSPRGSWFKKENVIVFGVIPALDHEPKSLNHFLEPAVNELNTLWKGVEVNTYRSPPNAVGIQAAVLCFASDIPAARNTLWIPGYRAEERLVSIQGVLKNRETTVALTTKISGKKGPFNSIEKMQTKLGTVNLRMLLIS